MFSGIIEEVGTVKSISKKQGCYSIAVGSSKITGSSNKGDSIAVDGVCLTLTGKDKNCLEFDIMQETFNSTKLKFSRIRDKVNLESALKMSSLLSGHIISGHIDSVLKVLRIDNSMNNFKVYLELPKKFQNLIVSKGSVALDGVSLTVQDIRRDSFAVAIIPYTKQWTNLGSLRAGSKVNVEFDIIAKYLDRMRSIAFS
ncbi:MAG: riboflavin synthase [Candidatus Omnitrophica bacterium]|nr:riboflavin synthase [Candidatus Omnitrophota bacterium]